MEAQSASAVLLVRPAAFGFNAAAARSNAFASAPADPDVHRLALAEFDALAKALHEAGVDVLVLDDMPEPAKPDAVFPNNWVSFHADGTMILYPMATGERRAERRPDDVTALLGPAGFRVGWTIDLTEHEQAGRFLEGTGSLILDRPGRQAFANRSARTDPAVIADFDRLTGYSTILFDAFDSGGRPIYHTNVLLSLGTRFAVLCTEAVAPDDRERLIEAIEDSGRTIVELGFEQLKRFGCNLIELQNSEGDPLIALSATALAALELEQKRTLESFGNLVATDIPTIESVGGGSVRCMIAEVHLPKT